MKFRLALLVIATCGCSAPPTAAPALLPAAPVPCGTSPREIGRLRDARLDEVSGVVESRRDPRVLFVHNDSGDSPRFFAIDRSGQLLTEFDLEQVPKLVDAEDIAVGPGPGGRSFVYLGDTGNNFALMGLGIPRRKAVVYRVPEPEVAPAARQRKRVLEEFFRIVFTFPRGVQDAEAFFVDPRSGDLVMISKHAEGRSQVLGASAATVAAGGGELVWLGELRFGQPPLVGDPMVTAASISGDGGAILIRTYSSVFLFERASDESIQSALSRPPRQLPAPRERQGEAISFVDHDSAFLTISEGIHAAVHCARLTR